MNKNTNCTAVSKLSNTPSEKKTQHQTKKKQKTSTCKRRVAAGLETKEGRKRGERKEKSVGWWEKESETGKRREDDC